MPLITPSLAGCPSLPLGPPIRRLARPRAQAALLRWQGAHGSHLLVFGATAVIRYTRRKATTVSIWADRLLERKPARLVTVAVANKMARIAWAVMAREENYRAAPAIA